MFHVEQFSEWEGLGEAAWKWLVLLGLRLQTIMPIRAFCSEWGFAVWNRSHEFIAAAAVAAVAAAAPVLRILRSSRSGELGRLSFDSQFLDIRKR